MDYWSLSCGIGTRARERNSSSCISYKCRIFHPESKVQTRTYLEAKSKNDIQFEVAMRRKP